MSISDLLDQHKPGWALDQRFYVDPAIYQLELDRIVMRHWIMAGHISEIPEPGDFLMQKVANESAIIVRATDNSVKAFANVCRHRAMPLLDGAGNCKRIRCPFHNWTYARNGVLIGAPGMKSARNFSRSDFGLQPVRIASHETFVFINLSGDAQDLATQLGSFGEIHRPWSFADLVTGRRHRIDVNCNWKLFIQVFMSTPFLA